MQHLTGGYLPRGLFEFRGYKRNLGIAERNFGATQKNEGPGERVAEDFEWEAYATEACVTVAYVTGRHDATSVVEYDRGEGRLSC